MLKEYAKSFIDVVDKKMSNHSKYLKSIYAVEINFISVGKAGYITHWKLKSKDESYEGVDGVDFILTLLDISAKYGLEVRTEHSRDLIVIYVDKVDKIRGFFYNFMTNDFSFYTQLLDHFEFRSYLPWNKKLKDLDEVVSYMQKITDEFFIKERYYYLTPNQRTRKLISKRCRQLKDDTAKVLFPTTYTEYANRRLGLFGGIVYCPRPNVIIEKPILALDIKSAYIYSLLVEKHCVGSAKECNPKDWEYFIKNPFETSFGFYTITYSTYSTVISCYKDTDGKNLKPAEKATVNINLTNIDLKIILEMPGVTILKVKCDYLESYDLNYIPEYLRCTLIDEYNKKNSIDKIKDPVEYVMQKTVLDGIYGNTIKKLTCAEYSKSKKSASLAPQWGIWTTAYTKKILLGLALQLDGWIYSDTDSIYCFDTVENRERVKAYNDEIRLKVKHFCEKFGYDVYYDDLKDIGTFEIEHEIVKFKALKPKEYMFTTKEGKIYVKAAGCNKEEMEISDDLYSAKHMPVGTRTYSNICLEESACEYKGKTYYSVTSYYEKNMNGESARDMNKILMILKREMDKDNVEF